MVKPSLSALKTFEAVARTGSLRAAAEALHITQSAVSHQLRRLEDSLSISLVVRQGRGMRLTPQGCHLAEGLCDGFARVDAAVDALLEDSTRERLRIGCLPSVAVRWLIPRLSRFRQRHPEISISFQYAGALPGELPTDIDVMITWQDAAPKISAERKRLFSGATWPVTSPHYLEQAGPCKTPSDLLRHELLHDESYHPWQEWFRHFGLAPYSLNAGMLYQDFNLLSAAAVAGQGVALCPPILIENELDQGTLVRLFDTPTNERRAYWLFHHPAPPQAVVAFRSWLLAETETKKCAVRDGDDA